MRRRRLLLAPLLLATPPRLFAETTSATLHIVVPFPAGGATDVLARLVADKLRGNYAPAAVVENRVGGSGRTGVEAVKDAGPDGSTLLFTPDFPMTVYPHSFRRIGYDPLRDFTAVALVARSGLALAAGPALPKSVSTVRDYLDWAANNPAQAAYATTGAGGTPHFAGVMLASESGVKLAPVHRDGSGPALEDLIGGRVAVSLNPISELLPRLANGKLRVLAVTSAQRSKFLPDAPTMAQAGFPAVVASSWFGFFAPARTPADIVRRLANGIADATQHGEVQRSLLKFGLEPAALTPVGFREIVRQDLERWGPIVKASGFRAED